jgi:hypothetical protein
MGWYNSGSTGVLPGNAVVRDANGNAFANNFISAGTSTAASGGTVTMTAASGYLQIVTGSGGITFKLPDARTLTIGAPFTFNNNQSSGNITIQDSTGGAVATVTPNGYLTVVCLSIASAAGSWDSHASLPTNVTWGSGGLNYSGSLVFQTLGTTALTLDTSQNVTIAKSLIYGGVTFASTTTGSSGGSLVSSLSPTLTTPNLGTPSTITLTNGTGLPFSGMASTAASTYTPTVTSDSGAPGSYTVTGATFTIGKLNFVEIKVNITTAAPATGNLYVSVPSAPARDVVFAACENSVTGKAARGLLTVGGGASIAVKYYDNSSVFVDGAVVIITGWYEH